MNEAHRRFQEWLLTGAEGDPARDLALHASVCPSCQKSIAALDLLAIVDPGLAAMPAAATLAARGGMLRTQRLAGAAAGVIFSAVILGIGASQLISLSRRSVPIGLASQTPGPSLIVDTATPEASPGSSGESLSQLESPSPTPIPTPVPTRPPKPGFPKAPTGLTAVASTGQIALSWSAPASNGGSPITRYDIYRDDAATPFHWVTTRSYIDLVANGVTHTYRVTAVNKVGHGPYSNTASGTTPNVVSPTPTASASPTPAPVPSAAPLSGSSP